MELEQRVIAAKSNKTERGEIIIEYTNFILSSASKVLKMQITTDDDVYSVALMAFDEAILRFDSNKGSFVGFASVVIKNRIADYLRKETRHNNTVPFSSLERDDGEGDQLQFDAADSRSSLNDAALEMRFLNHELEAFGICLADIYKSMPTYSTTRTTCMNIARHIASSGELTRIVKSKKTLPAKRLISELGVNEKILERYRKYIIAAVIVLIGEYDFIKSSLVNSHTE